jgi:hypothetical protein
VAPGIVLVVAAWMLDAGACAGMELGTPRVTIAALAELHHLLVEHGFRRRSSDGSTIVQEKQRENPLTSKLLSAAPRQLCIPLDSARLRGPHRSQTAILAAAA